MHGKVATAILTIGDGVSVTPTPEHLPIISHAQWVYSGAILLNFEMSSDQIQNCPAAEPSQNTIDYTQLSMIPKHQILFSF